MKYYTVIDTNVLVSSFLSKHEDSSTVLVVKKMLEGIIIPIYTDDILEEYKTVLLRDKFNFDVNKIFYLIDLIINMGVKITPKHYGKKSNDPGDIKLIDAYLSTYKQNKFIVTGNIKHFDNIDNVFTPSKFILKIKEDIEN